MQNFYINHLTIYILSISYFHRDVLKVSLLLFLFFCTVPSQGPIVNLSGDPGCYTAKLEWDEIPLIKRRGFITNYTIYYRSGTETRGIYWFHVVLNC